MLSNVMGGGMEKHLHLPASHLQHASVNPTPKLTPLTPDWVDQLGIQWERRGSFWPGCPRYF